MPLMKGTTRNTEYNDFSVFMNNCSPMNTAGNSTTFHNHSTSNWLSNWRSVSLPVTN